MRRLLLDIARVGAQVVQFAVAAREALIIATPEPTSITDA